MKILQSIPYPTYTTAQRDALVGVLVNYKINNSDTGLVEEWNGSAWVSNEDYSIQSTLDIVDGIATLPLDKDRTYTQLTASAPFEIQTNPLTRKDLKTASLRIYPNGHAVTFNNSIENKGNLSIDATKMNVILVGTIGGYDGYNIWKQVSYSDPQLTAPTLVATPISTSQIDFSWGNIDNNIGTEIQISADGINWGASISLGADSVLYQLTGLTVGQTRYARLRYIGDGVNHLTSDWSNTANATTVANQAPTASSVQLQASPSDWKVDDVITGSYIYADADGNSEDIGESGTLYQIKRYDSIALADADAANTSGVLIVSGFTGGSPTPTYTLQNADIGKSLVLWIQPKAIGGITQGAWHRSLSTQLIIDHQTVFTSLNNITRSIDTYSGTNTGNGQGYGNSLSQGQSMIAYLDFLSATCHDAIVIGLNDQQIFDTNANFEHSIRYYSPTTSIASKTPTSASSENQITGLTSANMRYMKIHRSATDLITMSYSFDGVNYTVHKTYQETNRNLYVSIYFSSLSTTSEHLKVTYGNN